MFTITYLATSKWHEANDAVVIFLAFFDLVLLVFACTIAGAVAAGFAA